jgi:hypothetical protein
MTLTLRLFTVWLAGLISTFGATSYDVVVYGATSAGIAAAVQVKRMGKSVLVVGPDRHLGGLTAGGLGWTDSGDKRAIGGLAREFYQRVWRHYQNPEAWRWQPAAEYRGNARTKTAFDDATQSAWNFEPHVAERVFEDLVREHQIPVRRDEWLDRERGVTRNAAGRITAIRMLSGTTYTGGMFIDATYEGDLMAAAGVSFHVGREGKSQYGEEWAGVQTGVLHHRHHFGVLAEKISPYRDAGRPDERCASPHQRRVARGVRRGRLPHPSLLLPPLPDRRARKPDPVPQAGGL